MTEWTVTIPWKEWLIAASIYASNEEDRIEITYQEIGNLLEAAGFARDPKELGSYRPPARLAALITAERELSVKVGMGGVMSSSEQDELQRTLRNLYGIELTNIKFEIVVTWEAPADPANPVPINDDALFEMIDEK